MHTSLNHQLHRSRLEQSAQELSNVNSGACMERQQVGVIGRSVRKEQLRFKDQCQQKLGETGSFLHQLRDFSVEPKPGVSESEGDLFATLQTTECIASSVNERWDAVTECTGSSTQPTAVIQTVRPPENARLGV